MSKVPPGDDDERGQAVPGRDDPPGVADDHEAGDEIAAGEDVSPVWRPGRRAPRVGVIGSSGAGKTTVMKGLVYSWLDEVPDARWLVWDHSIEWGEKHENLFVFPSVEYTFEDVCAIALELGDCNVVGDEIDLELDSKAGLPRGTATHALFNHGRHHNCGALWGVRRCLDIPRGITGNTSKLIVLLTHEPADVKWLRDKTGNDGTAERAQGLTEGDWFLWEAGRRRKVDDECTGSVESP